MDSKTQIYNFVTGGTAFDSVIYWNGELRLAQLPSGITGNGRRTGRYGG